MKPNYRNNYEALQKRDFRNGIIRLLETNYKILGSRRVLGMIANDILELHREFFPELSQQSPGTIVWRTTDASCSKPSYGTRTEDMPVKTVFLPLVTEEDIAIRLERFWGKGKVQRQFERDVAVVARLVKSAYDQGGLLSQAEVSALINRSLGTVSRYIHRYHQTHQDILPTKGIMLDQGCRPTHKAMIIALYEQGHDEVAISQKTQHSLEAVGRYLRTYKNIKLLMIKGLTEAELIQATGKSKRLINEYRKIIQYHHPRLCQQRTDN